jgi:serine phosphatase RsbU (regulator of sigma subunit)
MRVRFLISFFSGLFLFQLSLPAQTLANLHLNLASSIDSVKLQAANQLTDYYLYKNLDSAKKYNELSFKLAAGKNQETKNFYGYLYRSEILRLDQNYNEAFNSIQQALDIGDRQKDNLQIILAKLKLSRLYQDSGNEKEALGILLSSLARATELNHHIAKLESYNELGLYFKKINNNTISLEYFIKAFELAKESSDHETFFDLCINLGSLYERTQDFNKAHEFYKLAHSKTHPSDIADLAVVFFKFAKIFARNNQLDSAFYYYQQSTEFHSRMNDERGLAHDYYNIAALHFSKNDFEQTDKWLGEAESLSLKYHDSVRLAAIYNIRAKVSQKKGNAGLAKTQYQKALSFIKTKYYKEGFLALTLFKNLSDIYLSEGNYREAYENLRIHKQISDSVNAMNDVKKQTEIKAGFEYNTLLEKQRLESEAREKINQAALENEKQKQSYLLIGLGLFTVFLVYILYSYKQKQKANEILEKQKLEIERQKELVEERNHEIRDSINYALKIQTSSLPETEKLKELLPNHYLFFRPKDVVSGDFYWAAGNKDRVLFAVADCTGHGVPGAITSMIGSMLLNEIFYVKKIYQPNLVLEELNNLVKKTLKQKESSESRDGMDIAICLWEKAENKLYFSGANRPLYLFNNNQEFIEIKAGKASIGGFVPMNQQYPIHQVSLTKGDKIVLTTDGYADQFGGPENKKFTTRVLKNLLSDIMFSESANSVEKISIAFENWRGTNEQTDDVLLFVLTV